MASGADHYDEIAANCCVGFQAMQTSPVGSCGDILEKGNAPKHLFLYPFSHVLGGLGGLKRLSDWTIKGVALPAALRFRHTDSFAPMEMTARPTGRL